MQELQGYEHRPQRLRTETHVQVGEKAVRYRVDPLF
jgi:hypothetical protein